MLTKYSALKGIWAGPPRSEGAQNLKLITARAYSFRNLHTEQNLGSIFDWGS